LFISPFRVIYQVYGGVHSTTRVLHRNSGRSVVPYPFALFIGGDEGRCDVPDQINGFRVISPVYCVNDGLQEIVTAGFKGVLEVKANNLVIQPFQIGSAIGGELPLWIVDTHALTGQRGISYALEYDASRLAGPRGPDGQAVDIFG